MTRHQQSATRATATGSDSHGVEARPITPGEWAWVGIASLVVVALFSAPYLIGLRRSTAELAFGGHLFDLSDMYSYIAKMRYGAGHGWLLRLVYTTEPHAGGFAYAYYLGLGKLAALVSGQGARVTFGTLTMAYHAARVACGLLLLLVMYRFAADFLDNPAQRRLAWVLASLAGGLGYLMDALPGLASSEPALEFYVPEAFTPLLIFGLPHLALARTLLLAGWLLLFRAVDGGHWWMAALAGLAWGGMTIIVPFYGALLGVIAVVWLGVLWVARRRLPWRELGLCAAAGVLPLVVVAYNGWLFTQNAVFAAWAAQNVLRSPPPLIYLLGYGPLLALSIPGVVTAIRAGVTRRWALLLGWPLVAAALVYAPISVQRRLVEGVIVPLGVLAALGLWWLVGEKPESLTPGLPAVGLPPLRQQRGDHKGHPDGAGRGDDVDVQPPGGAGLRRARLGWRLRQIGAAAAAMLLFPSTLMLVGSEALAASRPAPPIFHPADERAALDWLRAHALPDSIVLATYDSSNLLPAYAGVRVYTGHGPETVDTYAKREHAEQFFAGGMTDASRRAFLQEVGFAYVWVGPPERDAQCECFRPEALGLREVFTQGDYTIYEVAGS